MICVDVLTVFQVLALPAIIVLVDIWLIKKYGYPSLALLTARCKTSKRFKVFAMNVWGNDDWYYEQIIRNVF